MIRTTAIAAATGIALGLAGPSSASDTEPRGSGGYFFCAMGQTVKYIGLFSGNAGLALAGAIGGGIACGMGW